MGQLKRRDAKTKLEEVTLIYSLLAMSLSSLKHHGTACTFLKGSQGSLLPPCDSNSDLFGQKEGGVPLHQHPIVTACTISLRQLVGQPIFFSRDMPSLFEVRTTQVQMVQPRYSMSRPNFSCPIGNDITFTQSQFVCQLHPQQYLILLCPAT